MTIIYKAIQYTYSIHQIKFIHYNYYYHYTGEVPEWCYPSVSCLLPPCILTMSNFSQYKKLNDAWFSPPFYTEIVGYKLQLAVHANGVGIGKGTHVSVFLHLMKSENDDCLKWPFSGDITVQLLNWRKDKRHVEGILDKSVPDSCTRVTKGDRAVNGMRCRRFISHADVGYNSQKNTQYLHNDLMCFRISKVAFPTGTIITNSSVHENLRMFLIIKTVIPTCMHRISVLFDIVYNCVYINRTKLIISL